MARYEVSVDMSDINALFAYVAEATRGWPADKVEALREELIVALDDGVEVFAEGGGFVAQATAVLFAALSRHGLNPVC